MCSCRGSNPTHGPLQPAPRLCPHPSAWTHPEELGLQQTLQDLVTAFPLSLLLQHALQEDSDLSDLSVGWEQINGLENTKTQRAC